MSDYSVDCVPATTETGESVYNLCHKAKIIQKKPKRYKSKYQPKAPPTCTTFGLLGTTKVMGTNIGGNLRDIDKTRKKTGAMGKTVKDKINTKSFTKKFSGTKKLNPPKKFKRTLIKKKIADVVKRNEAPIMGLSTKKNFIVTNIIENITKEPKRKSGNLNYLEKDDFGKVPKYLKKVKKEIKSEYELVKNLQEKEDKKVSDGVKLELLPEDERLDILKQLQKKRTDLYWKYQKLTFTMPSKGKGKATVTLDNTNYLVRKKEALERELDSMDKDIAKFTKKNVFITVEN